MILLMTGRFYLNMAMSSSILTLSLHDALPISGELFLDFPAKSAMLALDVPLVKRDGAVTHLGGDLGLPRVAAELYRSARRLRVFTSRVVTVEAGPIVDLVMRPRDEVVKWLAD